MTIYGIKEVLNTLSDPVAEGERFGIFFNGIQGIVFEEESPSQSDIQQFEKDGFLYCGDVIAGSPLSSQDLKEMVKSTIS